LVADVRRVLTILKERGERVDYLTFVPDGEPTLDAWLGDQIRLLKPLGQRIAVITNASLLSQEEVRHALAFADRVSVKVDAVRHQTWQRIDRPHGDLRLEAVLDGVLQFSEGFGGELDTETMLLDGLNDDDDNLRPLATFLQHLKPRCSYLAIPTRPPAVAEIRPAREEAIVRAHDTLSAALSRVELLTGFEGTDFANTGDARADLLAITAVHPMRSDQVELLLQRCSASWEVVEWLVRQQLLREVSHGGHLFYIRRLDNT